MIQGCTQGPKVDANVKDLVMRPSESNDLLHNTFHR